MMSSLLRILLICLAVSLAVVSCRGSSEPENPLVGNWEGDVEAMKELHPELAESSMAPMIFSLMSSMKVEFTDERMTIDAMGNQQITAYKVISTSDEEMIIKPTEGKHAGTKTFVKFLPNDRVQLSTENGEDSIMLLKRSSD